MLVERRKRTHIEVSFVISGARNVRDDVGYLATSASGASGSLAAAKPPACTHRAIERFVRLTLWAHRMCHRTDVVHVARITASHDLLYVFCPFLLSLHTTHHTDIYGYINLRLDRCRYRLYCT